MTTMKKFLFSRPLGVRSRTMCMLKFNILLYPPGESKIHIRQNTSIVFVGRVPLVPCPRRGWDRNFQFRFTGGSKGYRICRSLIRNGVFFLKHISHLKPNFKSNSFPKSPISPSDSQTPVAVKSKNFFLK